MRQSAARTWQERLAGWRLVSLPANRPNATERRMTVTRTLLVAAPTAFVFSVINFVSGHATLAHVELWSVLLLVLPIFAIVRRKAWLSLAEHLLMLSATIIFGSLLIEGGIGETGAYWVFMFPFAAFYITGMRGGWCWIAVFILIMLAAMVLHATGMITLPYAEEEMRIFPSTFLFYTLIAYVFNLMIARYEGDLERKVSERTEQALEAMRAVQERDARYRVLLERAPVAMLVHADDILLYANPCAVSLLGAHEEKALAGRRLQEFIVDKGVRSAAERLREVQRTEERQVVEETFRRLDGSTFEAETSALPILYGTSDAMLMIVQDVSERKAHLEKLQRLALFDDLTGLANRYFVLTRLEIEMLAARDRGVPLAVLVVDVNRFREINNILGYANGDELLKQLAGRLQDIAGADSLIGRLGGDEFIAVFPGLDMAAVLDMAGRIQEALEKSFRIEGTPLAIEASIGIALYPEHADKALALIQRADVAMRQARDEKSGMRPYDAERDPFSMRRLTMFRDLREALQRGSLSLHYQPKVDLKSGRVVGVEALARWQTESGERISPAEFVPLAEQTGLIRPLGLWVLDEAVSQCGAWRRQGLQLGMAINVSTWNLLDTSLPDRIAGLLERWGVEASGITLEITESAIMEYPETAVDVLISLKTLGLALSVDDFGTGHSSLAYLKSLPINELKIDQRFVADMSGNRTDRAIVRSTIDLAHELNLNVVAEGVEDENTWEALGRLSCDQVQGFYLSRPLPPDAFIGWLRDRNG